MIPFGVPFGHNAPMTSVDHQLRVTARSASPAEAAAIVAALARFMRDTAPGPAAAAASQDSWLAAAMLEGVGRAGRADEADPWINT